MEMEEYKVSVIVPVYNAEKYLRQCMDSIVNQTLREIEILCVNDGSTDGSLDILKEYAKADGRVNIISQKNAGAGAARNTGLAQAKGEYLSFLDADDFFEPDMLEKAYAKAKEGKADLVVFESDQYFEEKDEFVKVGWTLRKAALPPYRPMYYRNFTDNVFKVFVGWTWDKLFKREFVLEYNLQFQEQRTSNDLLFVFSAIVLAKRIEIVEEVLVHQRRDSSDSLSKTREKSWDCFYEALKALKANLIRHGLFYELEQDYVNYALHFTLWNLETLAGEKKEVLYRQLKKSWFKEMGIASRKEAYFYNKKEYAKYREIKKKSFAEYMKK